MFGLNESESDSENFQDDCSDQQESQIGSNSENLTEPADDGVDPDLAETLKISLIFSKLGQLLFEQSRNLGYSPEETPVSRLFLGFLVFTVYLNKNLNSPEDLDEISSKILIDPVD